MIDKEALIVNIESCRLRVRSCLSMANTCDEVMIVGASKTMPSEVVDYINDHQLLSVLGENKVSELVDKYKSSHDIKWHFIGNLQSNKVKQIIGKVNLIHSVDRNSLADEINKQAKKIGITANILVQVNMGKEESKSGFFIEELDRAITEISKLSNVHVSGVMAVMPIADDDTLISLYKELGTEYNKLKVKHDLQYLSAGMTNDFELAIIYAGSNIVRIGRAIFGERSIYGKNE